MRLTPELSLPNCLGPQGQAVRFGVVERLVLQSSFCSLFRSIGKSLLRISLKPKAAHTPGEGPAVKPSSLGPSCDRPRRRRNSWRLAGGLGLTLVLLLQACSAIQLGYNKADDLVYWWLDGYVDLSEPQSMRLRAALSEVHQWHRSEELPHYAAMLQQAQTLAADSITPAQACSLADAAQWHLASLTLKALPGLTQLALDVNSRQLLHIERQWAKKNAHWQDDWLNLSSLEREKKRLDNFVDRFESFYGSLSAAQVQLLRQQVQQSVWSAQWGWQDRLLKQKQLLDLLRSFQMKTPQPALAQEALQSILMGWISSREGAGFEMRDRLKQEACTNAAQLHNTTSPAQRIKAIQRLRAYASDLRALANP